MALNGIVAGVGSIFGAASSAYAARKQLQATRETNASNERIAKANNAFNRESMDLQNSWNLAQWNRENAYNSASAQADRLREAGLNPYLAMTQGADAGAASNLQSASAAPASDIGKQMPADYSGYQAVAQHLAQIPQDIVNAVNVGSQTDKNQADALVASKQAESLGIENWYKGSMYQLGIRKMISDLDVNDATKRSLLADVESKERENSLLGDYEVFNARKQQYVQGARLTASSAALNELDERLGEKQYEWFDKMKKQEFANLVANTAAAAAAANLSRRQAKLVSEQAALVAFDNMIRDKMSVRDKEQLKRAMVGAAVGACNQAIGEGKFSLYRGNNASSIINSQIDQGWVNAGANIVGAGASAANAWSNLPTNNTEASYEQLTHRYTQDGYVTTRSSKRTKGKR